MTREFLKNLGLEDAAIDKILDENMRDIGKVEYDVTRGSIIGSISGTNSSTLAPYSASDYTVSNIDGAVYFNPVGGGPVTFEVNTSNNSRKWAVSGDRQCVFSQSAYVSGKGYKSMYLAPLDSVEWSATYSYPGSGFGTVNVTSYPPVTGTTRTGQLATAVATPKAGSFVEYISASSSTAYPNGGVSGGYWYEYVGSDSIDPETILYPENVNYLGTSTPFPYTITPSKSNLHGGTISYNISYSKNGGSWVDGTAWLTELAGERYISDNTWKTYRLRVRARDNLGFTSATWIQGPIGNVSPDLVLSLSANPPDGGTVEGSGSYFSGTSVTVKATPSNGWEFVGWTENGETVSTATSYTFTITGNRNLTAVFKQKLTAWVQVAGKAKKGQDLFVKDASGKSRKGAMAWVRDANGKARRFL